MQKQQAKAIWNPKADRWEESTQDIYGRSDAYVETWPKSGMTRGGRLYELPTLVPPTTGRESSSSQPPQPPNERYLPTPNARDGGGGGAQHPDIRRAGGHQVCLTDVAIELGEIGVGTRSFGAYETAVSRWETITRPAPPHTQLSSRGNAQIAAPFSEWVMGLPEGWITSEEIGLTRNEQLRAAGNGVVPQQAEAALKLLIGEY